FFFSSRRRHTRFSRDWSSDVCSSDLPRGLHRSYGLVSLRFSLDSPRTRPPGTSAVLAESGAPAPTPSNPASGPATREHDGRHLAARGSCLCVRRLLGALGRVGHGVLVIALVVVIVVGRFLHSLQADQHLVPGQLDQGDALGVAAQQGHFVDAGTYQGALVGDQHDLLAVLHLDGADQLAVALVGHHGDHALATAALLRELLDRRALAVAALGGGEDLRMLFGNDHGNQLLAFLQAHATHAAGGTAHGAHVAFL